MKINFTKSIVFLLIIASTTLSSCLEQCEEKEKTTFSGAVQTVSGDAVVGALVQINADQIKTDQNGSFKIAVDANQMSFLVSVESFGYGLFSRAFDTGFIDKKITLTQGTIVEFDPTVDNTITDTNSSNNISQSVLLELDTSLLFNVVPRVYDHTGKLIDLGYPEEVKGIFDYVKTPRTTRRGMSMQLRANSLRNSSGNLPPAGKKLKAAVSTVDFFNPDGMPGNFTVRFNGDPRRFDVDTARMRKMKDQLSLQQAKSSDMKPRDSTNAPVELNSTNEDDSLREQLAYMESFGAATIDITDGEESYQLEEGMTATVTIPVYSIRQEKNEFIPPVIPLLHYNEKDGIWEVTGQGNLNAAGDAYIAEVGHFSVVNFDMVKTGDSKCFKIRQMLVNGANDNTITGGGTGALATYRAHLLIPETATSTFRERPRVIDESTGCVPILGTSLHGVSRLDNTIPYIVAVFSADGAGATDTLNIAIVSPSPMSIPAETAVADLGDCTTSTCMPADITNCETTNDAVDLTSGNYSASTCNTCWQPNCAVIPFDNSGAGPSAIVGVPMGGGDVNVKWVHRNSTIQSVRVSVHEVSCSGAELAVIQDFCVGGCFGNSCHGGSIIYNGTAGSTVYFKLVAYANTTCSPLPIDETCTIGGVTIL